VIIPPARIASPQCIFLGDDVVIYEHAWLSVEPSGNSLPHLEVGDRSVVGRWSSIACTGTMIIGSDVVLGDHVFVGDTFHLYEDPSLPSIDQPLAPPRPVRLGNSVLIGTGSVIVLGVTVGRGAIVDGGSVVTHDVPAGGRVAGNPAKEIGR
jgi:acetyltransferase-like isoleucine patch superfamily enzyme